MTNQLNNKNLYWTKDAFSLNHSIYEGKNVVGVITDNSITRTIKASIFGMKFIYEIDGFFKPRLSIIDLDDKKDLGRITFNVFSAKAKIFLEREAYYWEFKNFMHTKWVLMDQNDQVLIAAESRKEGYSIIKNNKSALLLLTALIIRNQFTKQGY